MPDVTVRPSSSRISSWLQTPLSIYSEVLVGLNLYLDFSGHTSKTVCSLQEIVDKGANT